MVFRILLGSNVVLNAKVRWNWRSSGMAGRTETQCGKQNAHSGILLIEAEYIVLLDLRHTNTLEGGDMIDTNYFSSILLSPQDFSSFTKCFKEEHTAGRGAGSIAYRQWAYTSLLSSIICALIFDPIWATRPLSQMINTSFDLPPELINGTASHTVHVYIW